MEKAVEKKKLTSEYIFLSYFNPKRKRMAEENIPRHLDIELLEQCTGGCKFCWNYSNPDGQRMLSRERLFSLIDEAARLGTVSIEWQGGEPLFYPWIFEASEYAAEKGIECCVFTSGIPLTREKARKIVQWGNLQYVGLNIETTNPETFARIHDHPRVLEKKLEGWERLLDAGFPPDRVFNCVTLTAPSAETFEETFDWCIDTMGARFMEVMVFVPESRGMENAARFEPSLSQVRRAYEHRARRMGDPTWARIGSTECSTVHCRTYFCVTAAGEVVPCFPLQHRVAGNIYRERLREIAEQKRDTLTLRDIPVKGRCAACENNDLCVGCRADAYHYAGDIGAPDPKCWLNPEAQETYLR